MFKELNVLGVFFNSPTKEFNVREAARILKKNPATISKQLKELAKRKGRIIRTVNIDGREMKTEKNFEA